VTRSGGPVPDVVVTGRGVVSSVGEGADGFFEGLLAKRSGIADGVGACLAFDPEQAMTPKEARRADRYTQLAVAASAQATAEAGLDGGDAVAPERLGVLVGTGVGGLTTLEAECRAWLDGGDRAVSPHFVPMMMPNAAAGTIAMRLGAHGPGFSLSSACATGSHAIGEALRVIQRGEADAVVCGGTEAALTGLCIAAFRRMGALSREGISRPFDAERDGFVMGEGAALVVLEDAEVAERRGATPYAELLGYGATSDAHHMVQPRADGREAARAATIALDDAGVEPGEIDYVNAHASSTPIGDVAEARAITLALGERAGTVPVSGTKAMYGHPLGASGAIEAAICALAIRDGWAPASVNLVEPEPELAGLLPGLLREGRAGTYRRVLSTSFGFGGLNAALVFGGVD